MSFQTVNLVEDLLCKLQKLMPENQQMLMAFADFLLERQAQSAQNPTSVEAEPSSPQQRILGLHQGMGWMSDDFNDPLPDEFWMGKV